MIGALDLPWKIHEWMTFNAYATFHVNKHDKQNYCDMHPQTPVSIHGLPSVTVSLPNVRSVAHKLVTAIMVKCGTISRPFMPKGKPLDASTNQVAAIEK